MTFDKIIYLLMDLPRMGDGESDDNPYTDRMLATIINNKRATLVKQDKDKGKIMSSDYEQSLGNVELVKVSAIDCCDYDPDLGDCILRTKNPIPAAVDTNGWDLLTYVGTVDGLTNFQRTTYQKVGFDKHLRWSKFIPRYYTMNTQAGLHIYIVNPPTNVTKYITIRGIFEEPEIANTYITCGCGDLDCFQGYKFEYPMKANHIDVIIKMVTDTDYRMSRILPKDETNDIRDNG